MSAQINPYAAPKAKLETFDDAGISLWRDGKLLVCRRDAVFPGRCIKCNDPAEDEPARFKLNWHAGGWYVLVFLNIIIYAIVASIVRKRATIEAGLCESHRKRRFWSKLVGWGGFVLVLLCFFAGAAASSPALFGIGALAILPLAIAGVVLSPQIRAARIDKEWLRVRGCGRDFLETLPEHPG
ncbi:MAG TPA: hypothetical protein VGN52_05290 [Burkholderiales bacterium]